MYFTSLRAIKRTAYILLVYFFVKQVLSYKIISWSEYFLELGFKTTEFFFSSIFLLCLEIYHSPKLRQTSNLLRKSSSKFHEKRYLKKKLNFKHFDLEAAQTQHKWMLHRLRWQTVTAFSALGGYAAVRWDDLSEEDKQATYDVLLFRNWHNRCT